jgi:dephospho-CoA kinase
MGSGKSTVAKQLRDMGFEVLDADEVARLAIGPGTEGESEVLRTFGGELRGDDGHLDRRALGRLVFAHKDKLAQLENLIHPLVRKFVSDRRQKLSAAGHKAAFYDVPLLYEKSMQAQFDAVIVVMAEEGQRHKRLWERSQLELSEITERTQHHVSEKDKERMADAVIYNYGSFDDLKAATREALKNLGIPLPTSAHAD